MATRELPAGTGIGETLGMLLMSTGKQVADRVKPAFDAENLRPRHGDLLKALAGSPSTTQQQLVETLAVDPSVLVGLLNELEQDGLIRRVRDPRDRRRHLVEISPRGLQTLDHLRNAVHIVEQEFFAGLTDDEMETLRRLLTVIRDGMTPSQSPSDACGEG